jgi:hypothetical protein
MNARFLYPAVLLVLLGGLFMSAAPKATVPAKSQQSFFDRLATPNDITRFTLTFDVDALSDMKRTEDYFPATFSHQGENWEAELKVRGRYRRRVCDFPPLQLKLSKEMLEAAGLQRHNKFKLVTHCSDNFDNSDNVLREQLAYDLYHLITGEGYRTQLVQVTYRNENTGESVERFGILIEDTDEMAQALGGKECDECFNVPQEKYVPGNLEQVTLFQYMIGNADYGVKIPRNVKHVQQQAGGQFKIVPYDFDFSGLVDAEYARPNPNLDQSHIKQRMWMWEFGPSNELDKTVQQFLAKEGAVMQLVDNYPHLSKSSKRQITKYLGDFYTSLQDGSFIAGV